MGGQLNFRLTHADVGKRVSVRSVVSLAEHPAKFTDTVGVLTSWADGVLSITRRDGTAARLTESSLVAGKVVAAAVPRRRGLPAGSVRELTRVAARGWPAPDSEQIDGWTLRAARGWTYRANSAQRTGAAPGSVPDLARIADWYAMRGLPARFQVATGAEGADELLDAELDRRGWLAARHAVLRVAALAPLADREPDTRVAVGRELTGAWLLGCTSAHRDRETAQRVLTGGPSVWFATVPGSGDAPAAIGRCVVDGRWAGFAAIDVAPGYRRLGLATSVMAELARTALADGASAAYLQVEAGNEPATALYRKLGFADHHHYHYRTAP